MEKFKDDIAKSDLCTNPSIQLDDLVSSYNNTLSSILDNHAPLIPTYSLANDFGRFFVKKIADILSKLCVQHPSTATDQHDQDYFETIVMSRSIKNSRLLMKFLKITSELS
ncbi:Hypothetical predicted protein [Paramuricea clavata]|uniref:Uncharacterized protein n=1 Tax=Paramuricea clavata TaxID=317549 RepID=A0A7D9HJY9_PARCT|nr:Hypothetical predicted protein [Paramuricea clavata]